MESTNKIKLKIRQIHNMKSAYDDDDWILEFCIEQQLAYHNMILHEDDDADDDYKDSENIIIVMTLDVQKKVFIFIDRNNVM